MLRLAEKKTVSLTMSIAVTTSAYGLVTPINEWENRKDSAITTEANKPNSKEETSTKELSISEQVSSLRETSGLSTEQLGRLFGVSRRSIHNWINGHRMASRHQERLSFLISEIYALPGDTPEEKRNALFYSVDTPSRYRELLRTLKRPKRLQYEPFSPVELLAQ